MKISIRLLLVLSLTAIISGCTSENDSEATEMPNSANIISHLDLTYPFIMGNQKTTIDLGGEKVFREEGVFENGVGGGAAILVRTKKGIHVQVNATGLTAGHAYSAWFRIWDGGYLIIHAAGNIVGASGNSTFAGSLKAGPIGEANGTDILLNMIGSFDDPMKIGVAVDIFDHGPAGEDGPGTIPENIHTFTGVPGFAQVWKFCPFDFLNCPQL